MSRKTSLKLKNPHREALTRLIDRALAKSLKPVAGSPRILSEAMWYCVASGGKRFRPLLCLGACEASGGDVRQALPAACAIELIHTYSLVHDDLPAMDNADERRGRPSCHRQFGEATAILVGDALLTRAFELLSSNGVPNTLAILRTLGQASGTTGLIGGQVLDLQVHGQQAQSIGHSPQSIAKKFEEIARRKTAALITASVVVGGLSGGASPNALVWLRRYGRNLGLAFQLMDDLQDQDGLVKMHGPDAVHQRAILLIDHAKDALVPFKTRGWMLRELADWLANS
jgi:geranylgeranyl diphosphate synthase type II